jgi:hypothetical protein
MYSRVNNADFKNIHLGPQLLCFDASFWIRIIIMVKGRREKKDNATTKTSSNGNNNTINDQIDRASAQLHLAGQQIGRLHGQWKTYLSGLSYIVIYLSYYQLRHRTKACHGHLELLAKKHGQPGGEAIMTWTTQLQYMGLDAAAPLVGLVLAILLCFFLRSCANSVARFSHPIFVTAQVCAVTAAVLYWIRTTYGMTPPGGGAVLDVIVDDNTHHKLSCVSPSIWTDEMRTVIVGAAKDNTIPFPCAIVFHVILALSLWFMNYQRHHHLTNVKKVDGLRNELIKKQQQQQVDTKKTK